jgi:transcriptional regulator with XRE-family HTH domain
MIKLNANIVNMKLKHGEQTEIAKKANCTGAAICDILKGRRKPSARLAKRLEEATGVPRHAWLWPDEYKNPYLTDQKNKKSKG